MPSHVIAYAALLALARTVSILESVAPARHRRHPPLSQTWRAGGCPSAPPRSLSKKSFNGELAVLLGAVRHGTLEAKTDAEVVRQLLSLGRVPRVEVVDQAPPFRDEGEEASPRGMILGVRDHVVRDVLDTSCEQCDLELGGAAVCAMALVR